MAAKKASSQKKDTSSTNSNTERETYTRYEKARMVGSRALQISQGAEPKIKLTKKDFERIRYNPVEIAKMELDKGYIPLNIKRSVPTVEEEESSQS